MVDKLRQGRVVRRQYSLELRCAVPGIADDQGAHTARFRLTQQRQRRGKQKAVLDFQRQLALHHLPLRVRAEVVGQLRIDLGEGYLFSAAENKLMASGAGFGAHARRRAESMLQARKYIGRT